jgi:hypothetical protein
MATKQELEKKLQDLKDSLDAVPPEFKADIQKEIDQTQAELSPMVSTNPTPVATQGTSQFLQSMMATLSTVMASGSGSVDSPQVREIIKDYLNVDKVKLSELDQSVLDEIKKNQEIVLNLPNFAKEIKVSKTTAQLPNFYEIIDDVLAGNNVYLIGEAGGGKAQSLNSKVLTENGWSNFGEIKVGDKVWGQDGKLYEVNGVYDRGVKDVYGITMNDGGYTETCDEHLWKIYTRNDRGKKNKGRVLPLSEFKDSIRTKNGCANAYVDVAKAIPFPKKQHIIDPYLMGVLIGDGSISQKSVSITNPSQELFDSLILPNGVRLAERKIKDGKCLYYGLSSEKHGELSILTKELENVNLLGKKSIQKFIPKEYLFDSIENRISLLQGLNDTDAYSDNSHFEFSTSSEQLAADYTELVRSLGGTAKITSKIPTFTYKGERKIGHIAFRIHCVFPDNVMPFKLSYKKERYTKPTKYGVKRFMDSIIFKGAEPVRCISVTNPEHLYVTDDYIVTHNTYTAEQISKTLGIEYVTLNCSQYTSPLEILGGQSVEGFKEGKLIDCWKNGKILILDEMPKLDPNTAGLFNDALAKSTKTKPNSESKINSANTEEPPIERANNFAVIATGNIYPNEPPAPQYRGNNQQDLSLLDRFSGSVYYTEFNKNTDEITTRFNFLYDFLVGNYYEYIKAKSSGQSLPPARGLRTIIESINAKNLALVSYRTNTAFRVAFEYELVRAIAKKQGKTVIEGGKTLSGTFKSYMVAFRSSQDTYTQILNATKYTDKYINNLVEDNIDKILSGKQGFKDSFNPIIKDSISIDDTFKTYEDFFVGEVKIQP